MSRKTLVGAIVALIFLAVALILGLAFTHDLNDGSTPFVVSILALVGTVIPVLLSLSSSEQTKQSVADTQAKVEALHADLTNGVLKQNVKDAIGEVSDESLVDTVKAIVTPVVPPTPTVDETPKETPNG